MERPQGFEESFTREALQGAIEQAEANISRVQGVLNGEREVFRSLQIARSQALKVRPINVDRVANVTKQMDEKGASLTALEKAIEGIRGQQAGNRIYIDYIVYLEGNGKRRA